MSDKTLKELTIDAHIAVLHTKVDALIEKQKETGYIGNDWAWAEYIEGTRGMSSYDIMHFNAPTEKYTFGVSVNDLFIQGLYFELSGKYNSQFNFESGGWVYSEDEQNQSYLFTGCG